MISFEQKKSPVYICGDLNNFGDLFILLQNLAHGNGGDPLVRTWDKLPDYIAQHLAVAGVRPISGRNLFRFAAQCWRRDIVFAGGQLIRDNASLLGVVGLSLAATVSRVSGGRIISRGLGISKLQTSSRIWIWRYLLSLFDYVQVRDETSLKHLDALLARKKGRLAIDVAFAQTAWQAQLTKPAASRERIVVAPCQASCEDRAIDSRLVARVLEALPSGCDPKQISIVCHDTRPGADEVIAATIRDELIALAPEVIQPVSLNEIVDIYRETRLVITNRLHSAIFGYLSGATVLILDDQNAKLVDFAQFAEVERIFPDASEAEIAQTIARAEETAERRSAILASLSARSDAQFAANGTPMAMCALPQGLPPNDKRHFPGIWVAPVPDLAVAN